MKATNNTIINSIMRTYMKYICAVVMLLGMSVSVWGADPSAPSANYTLIKSVGSLSTNDRVILYCPALGTAVSGLSTCNSSTEASMSSTTQMWVEYKVTVVDASTIKLQDTRLSSDNYVYNNSNKFQYNSLGSATALSITSAGIINAGGTNLNAKNVGTGSCERASARFASGGSPIYVFKVVSAKESKYSVSTASAELSITIDDNEGEEGGMYYSSGELVTVTTTADFSGEIDAELTGFTTSNVTDDYIYTTNSKDAINNFIINKASNNDGVYVKSWSLGYKTLTNGTFHGYIHVYPDAGTNTTDEFYIPITITIVNGNDGCVAHDVVYGHDGSGSDPSVDSECASETVSFTPSPSTGYKYNGATIYEDDKETQITTLDANTTSFSMYNRDVYVVVHYAVQSYTVNLDRNGGTTGATSITTTYNSSTITGWSAPSRTGYTFGGYYDAETSNNGSGNLVISTSGVLQAGVTGYTGAGGIWTKTSTPTTLYANWTVNSHKLSVASGIANITVKATPSGGDAINEGENNASVNYGTSVALSYTGLTSGYAINRWKVTKDADESDVTASCTDGNTLTMPDYDVTVDVILYAKAKMKTRCLDFDIDGDVWLTSYAGQEVFTTDAPENRITITCDDWGDADRMYVSYYNGAGESVAKASSLFRVCDASSYGKVDASNDYFTISGTGHASGVKYAISYQPGASEYDQDDIWTIRFTAKSGASTVLGYKDFVVHGRALPQYFAIVSKYNNKWYALPNTIVSNTASITPIEVTVDNTTTPTAVSYAPTTVKYKGGARNSGGGVNHRYAIGIYDPSDNKLKTVKDKTYVYLGSDGSTKYQDWYLASTDFGAYTMWIPSDDSEVTPKKMGILSGKIGYFGAPDSPSEQIYLLPVTNWLTPNDAKVTEWGQKSVILDVDARTASSAQAHFGNRATAEEATSFGETTTSVAGSASKYNYTLTFESTDFSTHKGELLYIDWLDGESSVLSTSTITIPWIIATSGKMTDVSTDKDAWAAAEVHVLPGVTLEADGGNFANKVVAINTLEIYPGATVEVTKGDNDRGSLNPSNLILRNGWTRAGEKSYDVARLYISSDNASVTKPSKAYSDWYIDYDQYYPIAVPWAVTTSSMTYLNSTNAASAGVKMKYYDGEGRANGTNGSAAEGMNWRDYSPLPVTLSPCIGYAMTARRPTGKAFSIVRMPLTIPSSSWMANGEQGEVSDVHKDQVEVTAYAKIDGSTPSYAQGWNLIANPYMSLHQGSLTYNDGTGDEIEYANVPDINFKEYDQLPIETTKLKPASAFLVQVPKTGTVTFDTGHRKASAPSYRTEEAPKASKQKAYILLSDQEANDMMGLIISDQYTAEYEMNADLEKLLGDGTSLKTYMRYGEMNMAYVAINETLAKEWIPVTVRIPETGVYTFSLHEASIAGELEGVYLIDYANGDQVTNLLVDSYTFNTTAGTISNRFAINAKVGERETPTAIDVVGMDKDSKEPVKFLWHDKVFIWFNGVIYDATGKKVR